MSFKINLNNPSKIAELQELEHLRVKFDIAGGATEGLFSRRWVYQNIFKLSEEEVQRIEMDQFGDAKHAKLIEAATMGEGAEGGLGDDAGLGGGDLGGGLGGADDGGLTGDAGAAEPEEPGPLLAQPEEGAPPANRSDKRNMGARRRSMKGKYSAEMGSSTMRNLEKGFSDGINTLVNIGENTEESEEQLIFETQYDIKRLIQQLETKDEGKA
jgi:hypothetical protein